MQLRIRVFAMLREKLRRSEIDCAVPEGATVEQLLDRLADQYPAIRELRPALAVAVNEEYVDSSHVLAAADEIALIPPVSGGAGVPHR